MAPFFFHLHIDKTGGQTLEQQHDFFFPNYISCNEVFEIRPNYPRQSPYDSVKQQLLSSGRKQEPPCNILSLEQDMEFVNRLESDIEKKLQVVTFLRQPTFQYLSRAQHDVKRGRFQSIEDFYLQKQDYFNRQSRRLGIADVEAVSEHLERFFFIGITEMYRVSICILTVQIYYFTQRDVIEKHCSCDFGIESINVHQSYWNDSKYLIPYSMVQDITRQQDLDILVYNIALQRLFQKVDMVENLLGRSLHCLTQP